MLASWVVKVTGPKTILAMAIAQSPHEHKPFASRYVVPTIVLMGQFDTILK
jgi:hypothetical protein